MGLIPAAFGRLCVETLFFSMVDFFFPAAFGRLCVETARLASIVRTAVSSRLRAAVC